MPLINSSSPDAFQKNIVKKVQSGKPQKQAEAIAYSQRRRSIAKKRIKN